MTCKEAQNLVMDYINRGLEEKKLESFLKHIRECRECYEELEIYYMIHFAIQRLDSDEYASYDIKHMLEEDLKEAERRVRRWKIRQSYRYAIMVAAEALLCLVILTQIQGLYTGSMEETLFYRLFFQEETQR